MKLSYLIDTLITPNITGLSFVDRYAGVVRTLNIAVDDQSDKGKVKRLPVACNVVSPDCANPTQTPTYDDLVPDDSKSSVIYWEVIQPMTDAGEQPTGNFYERKLKGTARIVVWLNLAKLGFDGCNDGIEIVRELEKAITQKGKISGGTYDGSQVWIRPRAQVKQDINTIFGQYDYKKLKNYYLYPFNFFAIDVDFLLYDCLQQGATVPTGLALDCVNQIEPSMPLPDTDLVLWLKADAGVNGGAVSNGDLVNTWADQSGNSNDFTQLVGASQPEYKSSGTLGVPCIYFNGFNSINRLSSTLFADGSVGTYFIVYQQLLPPPSAVNGGSLISNVGSFTTGNFLTFYTERTALGDNYVYAGGGFAGNQSVGVQDNLPHYIGVSKDATTMDYYYDSDTSIATNVVVQDWSVFQNHYLGSQTGAVAYMIGDIYEVLAWNKKLDAAELAEVATYFNSKYGL